jgi:hypothetical protein
MRQEKPGEDLKTFDKSLGAVADNKKAGDGFRDAVKTSYENRAA